MSVGVSTLSSLHKLRVALYVLLAIFCFLFTVTTGIGPIVFFDQPQYVNWFFACGASSACLIGAVLGFVMVSFSTKMSKSIDSTSRLSSSVNQLDELKKKLDTLANRTLQNACVTLCFSLAFPLWAGFTIKGDNYGMNYGNVFMISFLFTIETLGPFLYAYIIKKDSVSSSSIREETFNSKRSVEK